MGGREDFLVVGAEQEYEQGLREAAGELGGVHLRGDDAAHGEAVGTLVSLFGRFLKDGVKGPAAVCAVINQLACRCTPFTTGHTRASLSAPIACRIDFIAYRHEGYCAYCESRSY